MLLFIEGASCPDHCIFLAQSPMPPVLNVTFVQDVCYECEIILYFGGSILFLDSGVICKDVNKKDTQLFKT